MIDHLIDKDSLKNTTDIDFGRDGLNSLQILLLILFEWFRFKWPLTTGGGQHA